MNIKEIFDKAENGTLTYEEFEKIAKEANAKMVDLNEGNYISKAKHEAEIEAKSKEIETLNGTISTRDTDLTKLKEQLAEVGEDASKLSELTSKFEELQTKYDEDAKSYKKQLQQQSYEFAVKEHANQLKFTSQAAKRDYTQAMIAASLKMDKGSILGAEDFRKNYEADNSDAFVPQEAPKTEVPATESKPQFVGTTPGVPSTKPTSLSEMMKAANDNPGMALNF